MVLVWRNPAVGKTWLADLSLLTKVPASNGRRQSQSWCDFSSIGILELGALLQEFESSEPGCAGWKEDRMHQG